MENKNTERVVLSLKDKVLTMMCSFGLMLIIAAIFLLLLIPFVNIPVWPISLKLAFIGVATVWLSVILNKAGRK